MSAEDVMMAREEMKATAWMTRAVQAKAVEGCREEERGLGLGDSNVIGRGPQSCWIELGKWSLLTALLCALSEGRGLRAVFAPI